MESKQKQLQILRLISRGQKIISMTEKTSNPIYLRSVEITEWPTFTFKFIYCARSPEGDITSICFITIQFLV